MKSVFGRFFKLPLTLYIHGRALWINYSDALMRKRVRKLLNSQGDHLKVEFKAEGTGLFAQLSWCLVIWRYCERNNLTASIRLISSNYGTNGENWLATLRGETEKSDQLSSPWVQLERYQYLPFSGEIDSLGFVEAARLMRKYLVPSTDIQKEVADYAVMNFASGRTMGVHYRGTDKVLEAEVVSCSQMIETVNQELGKRDFSTVFVASDEDAFIEKLKASLPSSIRLVFKDHERSVNGKAIHKTKGDNVGFQRAREAMIDSLLLGHVTLLVKTPSMLSGWAKVYRPDLPVILVGKLRPQARFFPDKLLAEGFNA